jgi:glycine cleavage system transcriptional repressor
MRTSIVLTLSGSDRTGIVEEVTGLLLGLGGNVESSRMARLGGEFAILTLVTLPAERLAELDRALQHLADQGYKLTTTRTEPSHAEKYRGWLPFRIEVHGADHEGIVHDISLDLARRGINIESAETGTSSAPISGTPLFAMSALVLVPPGLAETEWIAELAEVAHQSNVDIEVSIADRV